MKRGVDARVLGVLLAASLQGALESCRSPEALDAWRSLLASRLVAPWLLDAPVPEEKLLRTMVDTISSWHVEPHWWTSLHALTRQLDASSSRARGAVDTPPSLAAWVLSQVGLVDGPVLDPACGSGVFLMMHVFAAARPDHALCSVHGVDVDGDAVAWCRAGLRLAAWHLDVPVPADLDARVRVSNALLEDVVPQGVSLVVGNPPYLDAEAMARQDVRLRDDLQRRFQSAQGAWDLCSVFVERSLQLVAPRGRVALLVPRALQHAGHARGLTELLLHNTSSLSWTPPPTERPFGRVFAYPSLLQLVPGKRAPRRPTVPATRTLGDVALIKGAATVAEAYAMRPLLTDDEHGPGAPFLNSGLIQRSGPRWGNRPCRYLGRVLQWPRMDLEQLAQQLPKRAEMARTPKLIISGLAPVLTGVVDGEGAWMAGKSTSVVVPHAWPLPVVLMLLHSAPVAAFLDTNFSGLRLRGGHLRLGPPQLKAIPVPSGNDAWVAQAASLLAQDRVEDANACLEGAWER